MVGAVIVKDGRIIGQGYHHRAGRPHAEIEALRDAGARARGATMFVTLEPCQHYGRTPPCSEALIAAGLKRVVIAARDPNPLTNGHGFARLRRAGLGVTTGVLERQARRLNAPFEKAMTQRLPFVIAKAAQSLDGKIATTTGESRWITSLQSRRLAHQLRRDADAILVGINTILRDDPLLTVRHVSPRWNQPVKVIVDSRLRIRPQARCLSTPSAGRTIVATTSSNTRKRRLREQRGVEVLVLPHEGTRATKASARVRRRSSGGRVPLRSLCHELARRGIQSLLIEGGGEVLAGAFSERLVDRIVWCVSPLVIGGRNAPTAVDGVGVRRLREAVRLDDMRVRRVGPDLCVEARVVYPKTETRDKRQETRKSQRSRQTPVSRLLSPVSSRMS
jgi:diaminohydroxyphosphoribosylaminopyrimidine deaminase/5-amino-6-(5-phosphoribosylamino)uracil reductase